MGRTVGEKNRQTRCPGWRCLQTLQIWICKAHFQNTEISRNIHNHRNETLWLKNYLPVATSVVWINNILDSLFKYIFYVKLERTFGGCYRSDAIRSLLNSLRCGRSLLWNTCKTWWLVCYCQWLGDIGIWWLIWMFFLCLINVTCLVDVIKFLLFPPTSLSVEFTVPIIFF